MFSEKIKELRKRENYTQEQLAEKLLISAQAISRWETQEVLPDVKTIIEIARLFQISVDELLGVDILGENENVQEVLNRSFENGDVPSEEYVLYVYDLVKKYKTNIELKRKFLEACEVYLCSVDFIEAISVEIASAVEKVGNELLTLDMSIDEKRQIAELMMQFSQKALKEEHLNELQYTPMASCYEVLLPRTLKEMDRVEANKHLIFTCMQQATFAIYSLFGDMLLLTSEEFAELERIRHLLSYVYGEKTAAYMQRVENYELRINGFCKNNDYSSAVTALQEAVYALEQMPEECDHSSCLLSQKDSKILFERRRVVNKFFAEWMEKSVRNKFPEEQLLRSELCLLLERLRSLQ